MSTMRRLLLTCRHVVAVVVSVLRDCCVTDERLADQKSAIYRSLPL